MKKLLFLAVTFMLGFGQALWAQELSAPGRRTQALPSYYRLNSVPASEMNAASAYIEEMLRHLYEQGPRTWNNFRNKQFLQRSDTPAQGELEFYKRPTETLRDELAVILDYIYLFHQINKQGNTPDSQELKRALINKIENKFADIARFVSENNYFRSYGTDPSIQILKVFAQTLQESVTIFIPPFALKDAALRDAIVTGLSKIYRRLLSVEILTNKDPQEKALKAQHHKDVDEQIELIAKYFTPPGLWTRTKARIKKLLYGEEVSTDDQIKTCAGLFSGSI